MVDMMAIAGLQDFINMDDLSQSKNMRRKRASRRNSCFPVLVVCLVFLFIQSTHADRTSNNIAGILGNEVENTFVESNSVGPSQNLTVNHIVKRQWGLPDIVAMSGKLLQCHIPNDAFSGPVQYYEVTAAGSSDLPSWLYFNLTSSTLEGVPSDSVVGQHYISVNAIGPLTLSGEATNAKDVFSIDVMPASHQNSRAVPLKSFQEGLSYCSAGAPVTKMTITIDADINDMKTIDRIQLVKNTAQYLKFPPDWIQLLSRKKESTLDLSAIIAGPGNVHQIKTGTSVLQWQVGCDGKIDSAHQEILSLVEWSSRNGSLADAIMIPVVGWHISTHLGANSRRFKRHLPLLYPTPVPSVILNHPPTRSVTWGDDNYNRDDNDETQPDSRVIPTMSSPTYVESTTRYDNIYPFQPDHVTHNHNSHLHRLKTKGRHHHPNNHGTGSPVYRPQAVTRSIEVYGTLQPTPGLFPIHPTPTTDEPSRTYIEETTIFPPLEFPESLQPSLLSSSVLITRTEYLPTPTTEYIYRPPTQRPTSTHPLPDEDTNKKPRLKQLVERLAITAGKVLRFVIPETTFLDAEDGGTRNLTLFLYNPGGEALGKHSWVQFDTKKQMVYGLPLKENIGNWKLQLHAMDSSEASVESSVYITVQQHKMDRKFNHEIVLTMDYDHYELVNLVDRNILLVEKLRKLYREKGPINESVITVRAASKRNFTWSNDSLVGMVDCPYKELQHISEAMSSDNITMTPQFYEILKPEFRGPRLKTKWLGHCKEQTSSVPTHVDPINKPPETRNQIDNITVTAGVFMKFDIPEDTFFDHEQGTTRSLRLVLFNGTQQQLRSDSWIRYDSTLNALVGLPLESDIGTHHFQLFAYDKENLSTGETFVIIVNWPSEHEKPSIEFSIVLETDFASFNRDLSNKLKVLDKLAHLYDDPDPKFVMVLGIAKGSVHFRWTNNSLSTKTCSKDEIEKLVKYLLDSNATISKRLTLAFWPEFNISKVHLTPGLACQKEITPTYVSITPPVTTIETEHATSDDEDIFISTILPAIVIVVMLLFATIIACILYRKKRKGKMSMEDNGTFVNKGIPVIFADELEEKPDPAKAPMIMKEEKPPLPPPEYPRMSSGDSSPSTPPTERKDFGGHHPRSTPHQARHPHHGSSYTPSSGLEHSENSPLYQPPPPFTTYRDSRMNRPKNTPTYRMPPPYVPP